MRSLVLSVVALATTSCLARTRSDPIVDDARILGVRTEVQAAGDFADADVGDDVRLTALVGNPLARAPVVVSWLACFPVDGQAVTPCEDSSLLRDPATIPGRPGVVLLGEGLTLDYTVPDAATPLLAATIDRIAINPGAACNTLYDLPMLVTLDAGDLVVTATKRMRLMPYRELAATPGLSHYVRNANPTLTAIRADATSVDCSDGSLVTSACNSSTDCGGGACTDGWCPGTLAAGQHTLCVQPAIGAAQVYDSCYPDGTTTPATEDLGYRWYATAGSFDAPAGHRPAGTPTDAPAFTDFLPPSPPYTLWLVVRDGRGGEDWVSMAFP